MADDTNTLPIFRANFELFLALSQLSVANHDEVRKLIEGHIEKWSNFTKIVSADFEENLQWFNVTRPLSMNKDLRGKMVVLDFFTYCCVNCQHILPDLKELERTYSIEDGLVVIGVHSPKFEHEKDSAGVLNAVLRNDISHPVVNDAACKLWQMLFVNCWPTLVVLGPEGQILFILMGEGHRSGLLTSVAIGMEYFKNHGRISPHSLPICREKERDSVAVLSFPGKLCLSVDGSMMAIADSGHDRIIITTNTGLVVDIIGSGIKGFQDGSFISSTFLAPQGVVWTGDNIYVADSGNHAIRKIDLIARKVETIVGNGQIGADEEGGALGTCQSLNTPWDLCLASSLSSPQDDPDVLLIAMAGAHQIWMLALKDGVRWAKKDEIFPMGACVRLYGSGQEEHRNNMYGFKAGFAQPSGICLDRQNQVVYVADSESSSIRAITLATGSVKNVVGAARDPSDLFCFGDVDGTAGEVRLQHPMAVAYSHNKKRLYVADAYNHKIKAIDPVKRECATIAGGTSNGDSIGRFEDTRFDEPSGICILEEDDRTVLFVADTNNHCIKALNSDGIVLKLPLVYRPGISPKLFAPLPKNSPLHNVSIINCNPVDLKIDETVPINLDVFALDADENSIQLEWKVTFSDDNVFQFLALTDPKNPFTRITSGRLQSCAAQPFLLLKLESVFPAKDISLFTLFLDMTLAFCNKKAGICLPKFLRFVVPCRLSRDNNSKKEMTNAIELRYLIGASK